MSSYQLFEGIFCALLAFLVTLFLLFSCRVHMQKVMRDFYRANGVTFADINLRPVTMMLSLLTTFYVTAMATAAMVAVIHLARLGEYLLGLR